MYGSSMEIDGTTENSIWLFDYGLMEDISAVPGGDLAAATPSETTCFCWPSQEINSCSNVSMEINFSIGDSEALKESSSQKRLKSESFNTSRSKACREKSRRERLNESFVELGSVLEPGRPPKTDKAAILGDAVRMVRQLRSEAQKLRESNEALQERIKELKAEKNELRIEKQAMKEEKEKLEQQVKAFTSHPPGFMAYPTAMPDAYGAHHGQATDLKLMPFIGYPGVSMWQFIPPAVRDTSSDHILRPPVA